ncbi:MAG: B12-binding domain-containing radical SAM protein [Magnetococcales bacterium]|nr:B12-binding domain-containing radical SAM protein [Magnetococcales bacterium]
MPVRITLYDYAYETLAIQYLASILMQEGFPASVHYDLSMDMDYLDQDFFLTKWLSLTPLEAAKGILEHKPEVVGFSLLTPFYVKLRRIIRAVKELAPEVVVVAGGPHPTLVPAGTLENHDIDFIFVGEADFSLPNFLRLLENEGLEKVRSLPKEAMPGVWNRFGEEIRDRGYGPFRGNLDEVPFPEKDAYYLRNPSLRLLYTATCSRGCVFSCTYCNSSTLRKIYKEECGERYFRVRSVGNVIEELRQAKERYRPKYVMFLDNLFAPQISWLRKFAEEYPREVGLPFFCETNPMSHTRESLELIAKAGCVLLQFGFQSANEEVRRTILGRRESNDRIRELVVAARELGMFVCVDHIANLPGEVRAHLDEAVALYQEIRPNWINLGFLQYYPESDIIEIAISRRFMTREEVLPIFRGESQSSFRLLARSGLGEFYHTLPIRLFAAFKLPPRMGNWVIGLLEHRLFTRSLSWSASLFIYASRIFYAFTDRRDFLIRHHIVRNLYVIKNLALEKWRLHGGH